jgi:hypothetical protein
MTAAMMKAEKATLMTKPNTIIAIAIPKNILKGLMLFLFF